MTEIEILKTLNLIKRCLVILILSFTILACSGVGEKYQSPEMPMPQSWTHLKQTPIELHEPRPWWHRYHDPRLNELLEHAKNQNLDIKTVATRIQLAQAQYRTVSGDLFPTAQAQAFPPNGTGVTLTQVIGMTAMLELDLFGRIRQTQVMAQAATEAEQANEQASLARLYAEIIKKYFSLREEQKKIQFLRQHLDSASALVEMMKSRYRQGLISYMHVQQQETLVISKQLEIAQSSAQISLMIHQIEQLTGHFPGQLRRALTQKKSFSINLNSAPIRTNLPSSVLQKRADVLAAERQIAAAHAQVRVAIANLFPKISVGWILGWQTQTLASNIMAINNPDSTAYGIFNAPMLNLSLYRTIDVQRNKKRLAVIAYQLVVMHALFEVNLAQENYQNLQRLNHEYGKLLSKKRLILNLSMNAYQHGLKDYLEVLQAQEDLSRVELMALHHKILVQHAVVDWYTAIGG